jgi:hypothetical protein
VVRTGVEGKEKRSRKSKIRSAKTRECSPLNRFLAIWGGVLVSGGAASKVVMMKSETNFNAKRCFVHYLSLYILIYCSSYSHHVYFSRMIHIFTYSPLLLDIAQRLKFRMGDGTI